MLINTTDGVLNTDHIISAKADPRGGGESHSTILFSDGAERTMAIGLWRLKEACGSVIAAQPGYTLVHAILPSSDEPGICYLQHPIIAFRVAHGRDFEGPMPITAEGEPAEFGSMCWTILQPNGRCNGPYTTHDDLDAFKVYCDGEAASVAKAA